MIAHAAAVPKFCIEDHVGLAYYFVDKYADYDREEAVQDAMLALWRAWQSYDPTQSKFSSYAGLWAKSVLQRHRTRPYSMPVGMSKGMNKGRHGPQKETRTLFRVDSADMREQFIAKNTDAATDRADAADEVRYALQCLNKREQITIRGIFLSGFTGHDVAMYLGITHQAVAQIKDRALVKMNHYLRCMRAAVG